MAVKLKQIYQVAGLNAALLKKNIKSLPSMSSKVKFSGRVDGFEAGIVRGWVKPKKKDTERLVVEISCEGRPLKTISADMFRQDLKDAGLGDGCYAFETHLGKEAMQFLKGRKSAELVFNVQNYGLLDKLSIGFGQQTIMTEREVAALKLDFDSFNYFCNEAPSNEVFSPDLQVLPDDIFTTVKRDTSDTKINALFPSEVGISPISSSFSPRPAPTPYLEFSRDKMKVDGQYLTDVNPHDIDGLLRLH